MQSSAEVILCKRPPCVGNGEQQINHISNQSAHKREKEVYPPIGVHPVVRDSGVSQEQGGVERPSDDGLGRNGEHHSSHADDESAEEAAQHDGDLASTRVQVLLCSAVSFHVCFEASNAKGKNRGGHLARPEPDQLEDRGDDDHEPECFAPVRDHDLGETQVDGSASRRSDP